MPSTTVPFAQLGPALLGACLLLLGFYLRQLRSRDATAVDLGWTLAIGLCGAGFALAGGGALPQRALALLLALAWSGRLAWHLWRNRVCGSRGEDGRYAALRRRWGSRANLHFAWFHLAQGALAVLFALPYLLLANLDAPVLLPMQYLGLLLFAAGFGIETLADRQLAHHRLDPAQRGRTCRRGLWALSRHPNYFGEWLLQLGLALLALPAPHGWLALCVPLLLYLLLRFVTGIPPAELQALKSRGDDYRAYQRSTNAFFPWWPRPASSTPRP